MQIIRRIILAIILSYTSCVYAGLSGTVDATSNYVWRGISLTNNNPALQGELTYTFDSGLYLNLWGSNVDFSNNLFAEPDQEVNARIEVEYGIGYTKKLTPDFAFNFGVFRETYPGSTVFDYNEARLDLFYKIFNFEIAYSNNVYNTGGTGIYYNAGIAYPIPPQFIFNIENILVAGNVGYYDLAPAAGNSYVDYKVAISKQYKQLKCELAWTDTNGHLDLAPLDDSHVIFTVYFNFG